MRALGIDTSNYTCSTALYDSETGQMFMAKQLLPTPEGALGLRQSQAVFEHVKLLGQMMDKLFAQAPGRVDAVGVSTRPRSAQGSYMPCFLTGAMAAQCLSAALGVPKHNFSHQQGHIAAALYSAEKTDWLTAGRFLAFHVSGGTTDCLLVTTGNCSIESIELVGSSLDLKAGQAVDRVGGMLGLPFPSGPSLEQLALRCTDKIKVKPTLKGIDCCLSGVENKCAKLLSEGAPQEYVACFCIEYIQATLEGMLKAAKAEYGELPLLFAGGVMSNSIIRGYFEKRYGASFAQPAYSADNAGGIALLAAGMEERNA